VVEGVGIVTGKGPEAKVIGNEQVEILGHSLIDRSGSEGGVGKGVAIGLRNVSGGVLGKVVFRTTFYDARGRVLDEGVVNMWDFGKDETCVFPIECERGAEARVKSYDVKVVGVVMTPAPMAKGDDRVEITEHHLREGGSEVGVTAIGVAIRNVSGKGIARAVFDAVLYDSEGKVLGTVRHREFELRPNESRVICISDGKVCGGMAKSYNITTLKTVTTDVERIRVCMHEMRTVEDGVAEVTGIVKNMSDVKTDAALVAVFKDSRDRRIGTRIVPARGIEAGTYKQFCFRFDTPKGETVNSCFLDVGEMVEGIEDTQ